MRRSLRFFSFSLLVSLSAARAQSPANPPQPAPASAGGGFFEDWFATLLSHQEISRTFRI